MRHKPGRGPPGRSRPGRVRWPSCSRCASGRLQRFLWERALSPRRAPGRFPAARSPPARRSRRRSGGTSRRRSTSERSRTSSSSARGAIRAAIPRTVSSRPPSSASSPPASTRSCPRTLPGSPSTACGARLRSRRIVLAGRERLRGKLSYTNIGFALAPPTFTLSELRDLYTAALGHDVSATNLKRVLLRRDVLEATGSRREPGRTGGRPAEVYRFRVRPLESLIRSPPYVRLGRGDPRSGDGRPRGIGPPQSVTGNAWGGGCGRRTEQMLRRLLILAVALAALALPGFSPRGRRQLRLRRRRPRPSARRCVPRSTRALSTGASSPST